MTIEALDRRVVEPSKPINLIINLFEYKEIILYRPNDLPHSSPMEKTAIPPMERNHRFVHFSGTFCAPQSGHHPREHHRNIYLQHIRIYRPHGGYVSSSWSPSSSGASVFSLEPFAFLLQYPRDHLPGSRVGQDLFYRFPSNDLQTYPLVIVFDAFLYHVWRRSCSRGSHGSGTDTAPHNRVRCRSGSGSVVR